jgi:hypothetical protein
MSKIDELDLQIQQLKNKRSRLAQREAKAHRTTTTRQQIILGAWLMTNNPSQVLEIKGMLTRQQDIQAFEMLSSTKPSVELKT